MRGIIALTGATGFIGSTLAPRLIAAGWHVRALARPTSSRSHLADFPIEWIEGHLEDPTQLPAFVNGAAAVVHCAGVIRGAGQAHFQRVNAHGVGLLARAAVEQQAAPRFLLISSLAAREPSLSPYAASKRQGEVELEAAAGGMARATLRPPAVYGPGDRGLRMLFRCMQRGIGPVLGQKDARFSLLYVDDLADAVVQWLEARSNEPGPFELDDGHPYGYGWEDVIAAVARLRAKRIMTIHVPEGLLVFLARLNQMTARIVGGAPMLTPGKVRELRHPNWVCDNMAFRRVTAWQPQVSLDEGLRRTLQPAPQ